MSDKVKYLELAKEAYKNKHQNKTTLQVYQEKILKTLWLINGFRFSTPTAIDYALQKQRGFAKKLYQKGYLIEHEVPYTEPYMPKRIYTLSRAGREYLERNWYFNDIYIWTGKINDKQIYHDYLTQLISIALVKKNNKDVRQILGPTQIHYIGAYKKNYDAVIVPKSNYIVGIETDLSEKKPKEVKTIYEKIQQDIKNKLISLVFIYFPEKRYTKYRNIYLKYMPQNLNKYISFFKISIPFRPYIISKPKPKEEEVVENL